MGSTRKGFWQPLGPDGDRAPFVKWSKEGGEHLIVEVLSTWNGKYGPVARAKVREAENVLAVTGSGEDRVETSPSPGEEVNIALNLAMLAKIDEGHVGKSLKIANKGWGETEEGKPYRDLRVSLWQWEDPIEGDVSAPDLDEEDDLSV